MAYISAYIQTKKNQYWNENSYFQAEKSTSLGISVPDPYPFFAP